MAWWIKMPDGTERPATEDEVVEIQDPRWAKVREAALGGLAAMSSEDPTRPSSATETLRNVLVPRSRSTAAAMYGTLAAGELPAVAELPFYLRYPALMGTGAAISKLTGGTAGKGAMQGLMQEGGTQLGKLGGGVLGRLVRGSEIPSRNVSERVAKFIGDKLDIKIGAKDIEPLLVRGGPKTGLAVMARGNQKPSAELLKRVFHDSWDYEKGEIDQPALVNHIVRDHWDELVQHLGKRGAQDLLNAASGYPAGTLPGEAAGKLQALPAETAGVSLHPPYHLRIHPFRTHRPPGPLDRFWSPEGVSIMRGFTGGATGAAMPYLAPEQQVGPSAAPAPAARPTPVSALPRRAPSLGSLLGEGTAEAQEIPAEVPGSEVLDPLFDPAAEFAVTAASHPLQEKAGDVLAPVMGRAGSRELAAGLMSAGNLYAIGKSGGQAKRLLTDPAGLARDVAASAKRAGQIVRRPITEGGKAFTKKYGVRAGQALDVMTDPRFVDPRTVARSTLQMAREQGKPAFKAALKQLFHTYGGDEAVEILKPIMDNPEVQEVLQHWEELVP